METKLAAYRANKAKQKEAENSLFNRLKVRLFQHHHDINNKEAPNAGKSSGDKIAKGNGADCEIETESTSPDQSVSSNINDETMEIAEPTTSDIVSKWILRLCKLALWFCLWGFFIEVQFGAVFFAISVIVFTYFNTRTGPRDGKLSAYSVFNKDCERIQGTVTAEQMQKSMFGFPGVTS